MKSHRDIYNFLNSYGLAVLSTINTEGLPHAAIVGFGQTQNLEILFGTDNTSRKYRNLKANPHIAFAIGGNTPETVQYEGIARELSESELRLVRDNYWKKNPHAEEHSRSEAERYFIVTPTWIRYTDLRIHPWDISEIDL